MCHFHFSMFSMPMFSIATLCVVCASHPSYSLFIHWKWIISFWHTNFLLVSALLIVFFLIAKDWDKQVFKIVFTSWNESQVFDVVCVRCSLWLDTIFVYDIFVTGARTSLAKVPSLPLLLCQIEEFSFDMRAGGWINVNPLHQTMPATD